MDCPLSTNCQECYFENGPRDTPRPTAMTWLKMKDQRTLERFRDQAETKRWDFIALLVYCMSYFLINKKTLSLATSYGVTLVTALMGEKII